MKTLYLSDLDNTLLRPDGRVSEYSAGIINSFIQDGGCFSFATARSVSSALFVTAGLGIKGQAACSDGCVIIDIPSNEVWLTNSFADDEIGSIRDFLGERGVSPVVYACVDGKDRISFIERLFSPGTASFIGNRTGDARLRGVETASELFSGDIFRLIWTPYMPESIFEEEGRFSGFCRRDYHSRDGLCDLSPVRATKGNAALQLKDIHGCDRLAVFGDDMNDMTMLLSADEGYAMSNAIPEVKQTAAAVICSNDYDGVARWIKKNAVSGAR